MNSEELLKRTMNASLAVSCLMRDRNENPTASVAGAAHYSAIAALTLGWDRQKFLSLCAAHYDDEVIERKRRAN